MESTDIQQQQLASEVTEPTSVREPTIIFLFDMKNWYEKINSLSKLDLLDIAPIVSTQFYIDFSINAYVLILTKNKWDQLNKDIKRKFMFISRRIKEEMESPMSSVQKEVYENSDIFELLMTQQPTPESLVLDSINEENEEIIVPEL